MKTIRIEESQTTDPQGIAEIRHKLVRVIEVDASAVPEGAKVVDAEPHDWKQAKA